MAEIRRLPVNRKGRWVAPHKAVLLLAVLELIEAGEVDSPFVPVTRALERSFSDVWRRYVPEDSPFSCGLNYPFFHLSSSSFWQLVKLPTYEDKETYSLPALKRSFAGAMLPRNLFEMLRIESRRQELRNILISSYLSDTRNIDINLPSLVLLLASAFLVA